VSRNLPAGRIVSAIAFSAVAALTLAGCGSGGAAASGPGASSAASAIYTWISNENDRSQWQSFIDAAKKTDPGFNLTLEGPSFPDYWTKVKTREASPGAPCIITTQGARAQELKDLLAPLDDLAKKNNIDPSKYNQAMIQGMTVDGKLRAIPYDAAPFVLYYNKDLFQAAGLKYPTENYTRAQFISDAKALTKNGVYGLSLPPQFVNGPAPALAFADGHYPVKDGNLDITNPDFVKDVQFTFDLVNKEHVAQAPQASDVVDVSQQQFMSGQAAMTFGGPWMYQTFTTKTKGTVGVAVIPSTSGNPISMIQGSGFGIAASCQDKEAAFANIMKITTADVIGAVGAGHGNVPTLQAAMTAWAGTKPAADVSTIETLLKNGKPLQTTKNWNQVETLFTQYSVEGFRGTKSAETILNSVASSAK
jgi:multiple sugar transport system substrate-binding protein